MAGVIKEVAMNASSPRKARASLPVRVALIIIAVALVAVALCLFPVLREEAP